MVNGGKLEFWVFVNFSSLYQESCVKFCEDLVNVCNSKGMVWLWSTLITQGAICASNWFNWLVSLDGESF